MAKVMARKVKEYLPRDGSRLSKEQARRYGAELERLGRALGRPLAAADIVAAARETGSPLHDYFQWDTRKAAAEWLLHSARVLARSIEVRITTPAGVSTQIEFLHPVRIVSADGEKSRGYATANAVQRNPEWREQVLEQARRELAAWQKKYAEYREYFGDVPDAIDRVVA